MMIGNTWKSTFTDRYWRIFILESIVSDIDEILEEISDQVQCPINSSSISITPAPNSTGDAQFDAGKQQSANETVTLDKAEYQALIQRLQLAEAQVKQREEQLQHAVEDLENMRLD